MSLNVLPLALPCTDRVCVRAPQPATGSFRTIWVVLTDAPRSTCSHCGKALFALSQYVPWFESLLLPGPYPPTEPLAVIVLPSARFGPARIVGVASISASWPAGAP